jgi:hypothetical protein
MQAGFPVVLNRHAVMQAGFPVVLNRHGDADLTKKSPAGFCRAGPV